MAREIEESRDWSAENQASRPTRFAHWSYSWVTVVVVVGLLVTAALSIVSALLASSNEDHLLKLRGKEVASALTAALPDIQTPLGAAVALADADNANAAKFREFTAPFVGPGHSFASISLWRVGHFDQGPVIIVGDKPELSYARGGAAAILRAAAKRSSLTVKGLLRAPMPRLAYAYSGSRTGPFVAEAEATVAANRYTKLPPNSAYSNVNVAVYIAKGAVPRHLLLSTVRKLPLSGRTTTSYVPFGSDTLTVVVSARQPLTGTLTERLPWVIALFGLLLTIAAGFLTLRLIVGRRRAEELAGENSRLYAEQRGIAQSLQHSLLPEALPEIDGVQLAARYQAGAPGVDIGGDWYDLIRLGPDKLMLVIGDVSGRGIRAAAAMASLRFAIEYAAQSEPPAVFLPKLSDTRALRENRLLATVLCVVVELSARRVSVTSAGHPPPLMVHDGHSELLQTEVGLPIGIDPDSSYATGTFTVPRGAAVLGFTDGLVERHDETLDDGLDRLCRVAAEVNGELEELMTQILERVRGPESLDDTAIAGIKWMS